MAVVGQSSKYSREQICPLKELSKKAQNSNFPVFVYNLKNFVLKNFSFSRQSFLQHNRSSASL